MGLANEPSNDQFSALLKAGLQQLSRNQAVSFQKYTKTILPADGYVFWVASGSSVSFTGSLHVASDRVQEEDQTIGINSFIFTSENEITELNDIDPVTMWVGTWATPNSATLQIAFSRRGPYYQAADIWHYSGFAVYPALSSQLVNAISDLPAEPIVSNSLPIWLALQSLGVSTVTAYPSFLVAENIAPPYVSVHIDPEQTDSVQGFPVYSFVNPPSGPALGNMISNQLMTDRVRLTFYGLTNQQAIQYYASLISYSRNTDAFGFMNSPAIRDGKRSQVEIRAIAMKKTLDLDISYYQTTADALAKRLIKAAAATISIGSQ
ncbi:MAG: hypothetical protein ACYDBI_06095 [Thermoplasmataceae archaeon]